MNAQQISWLPEEVRNHIAQLERDLARVTEVEVQAERYRLATLRQDADLARVTAERDHLKSLVFDGDLNFSNLTDEYETLRARVAELVRELSHVADCSQNRDAENMLLQQRNADLVAVLEKIAKSDPLANGRYAAHNAAQALARAESAMPDHLVDANKMPTPAKHPDTEIVDWLDAQFQGGDDWCRLFPLGNTIREAYAARKQEASK